MNDDQTGVPHGHAEPKPLPADVVMLVPLPDIVDNLPDTIPEGGRIIAILDSEATSTDPATASIVELAIMAVIVDAAGRVVGHTCIYSWLEDPKVPLTKDVRLITKLDDEMLRGQQIDERAALGILSRAELLLAHHAAYDAVLLERRLPAIAGKAWACSLREVPWLELGYDGCKLGHLVMQAGWHAVGHRAAVDVAGLFCLLQVRGRVDGDEPRSNLSRLLERADRPTVRVEARWAAYGLKDQLKAAGYRWDPDSKTWWTETSVEGAGAESDWLKSIGVASPLVTSQTAQQRYRPFKRLSVVEAPEEGAPPF